VYRPPWILLERRQFGLATLGQRSGALILLDDFAEDIANAEKDKSGGYGIVPNQLD